jgi:toxin CcdB
MAQFDLYVNTNKDTNRIYPYFVDIQNGLLDTLNSRVVIPLTPIGKSENTYPRNLCPIVKVGSKRFALLTHQLASISIDHLRKKETSLAASRDDIIAALDFLITGI